ncbi:MAG: glycine betaine ABC transporter substrate-binding protein [Candidatus Dormibacteria bacterium]
MHRRLLLVLIVALPAVLAACGGGNNPAASSAGGSGCPGSTSSGNGNGASVSIGSKAFDEEQVLASITQQVLQKNGFKVTYTFMAADKAIGTALQNGNIDMYWQYTGTELGTYLGLTTGSYPTDLHQAFNFVQQKDAPRGLCWYAPTDFDDTNGVAIPSDQAATYGTTLGQFGQYLTAHPSTSVCIMSEFRTRPDGLPGLESTYGWPANANYVDIQNTAEKSIAGGQCTAGEVFTTDAGIAANNLVVLQDDKKLFPPDNAGLVIRQSVAQKYPQIGGLMEPIAAKLTTDVVKQLNAQVDIQNMKASDVAHAWLVQNGFLSS